MKKMIRTFRTSVTARSLAFLILLTTGILVCMELVTAKNIQRFEQRTLENYQNSIETYCAYWDDKLEIINNSVVQLTSINNDDMSYWSVCNARKTLEFETSKTMLMNSLSDIARTHQNEILVFCSVPEREVYLKSTNHLVSREERERFDEDVRSYVVQNQKYNSTEWSYFESGGVPYFINVFSLYGGYIGVLVPCATVLEGVLSGDGVICETVLTGSEGEQICSLGDVSWQKKLYAFQVDMAYIGYRLQMSVPRENVFTDRSYLVALSLATVAVGLLLLVGNLVFQIRFVLGPLNTLKRGMERFSQGEFDLQLETNHRGDEIDTLFETFNNMIRQIADLKIEVYEGKLEQERIQSNYLRVQIQPHFYTNILTLIYGLAQMKDDPSIQKLSLVTGKYFRYLMGEKGTFVVLREELDCVKNYFEIQKMRYGDCLAFSLETEEGLEGELVLPMVLQTFAGNSIKHNITLVPVLQVQIRIRKRDGMLKVEIEDNGVGFAPEILQKINEDKDLEEDGEHIGIRNVKERLRLLYGEQASVHIESRPGRTVVYIMLLKIS